MLLQNVPNGLLPSYAVLLIAAVTHAPLVGMSWAHAVAAVIEDAAC